MEFNESTLPKLKGNDPTITGLRIQLDCDDDSGKCFLNSIDWKKDGDCISNNTQLKSIEVFM